VNTQSHIVIVGGTACGPKTAARTRRLDPHCRITLIEQGKNISTATCGLPYYVSGVIRQRNNLLVVNETFFKNVLNVDVLLHTRATAINRRERTIDVIDLNINKASSVPYDKLVIATGSMPVLPDIPGIDLAGIYTLTRISDADVLREMVLPDRAKRAVVIGAGLIGLETTEALVERGLHVTLIEALNTILPAMLDFEIARYVEKHLKNKGVTFLPGQRVTRFDGNDKNRVCRVVTGEDILETDIVIIAIGVRPNVNLARDAGIEIGATGGIAVNEYLQTNDPDIYAGGDCIENIHRITGRKVLAPLGSTANKHGRIIGANITGGKESFPGVMGTAAVKVFNCNVARTGLNENQARELGYDVVTSIAPNNEYASYYPGGKEVVVKLVADRANGKLLGGQVVGTGDTSKRADVIVTALTFGAGINDMANLDLAYAPPYNSAMDPLHVASNIMRNKLAGIAQSLCPMEVQTMIDNDADFILRDVRNAPELVECRINARQVRHIPLGELRTRHSELPPDAEIVILCHRSVRAYQAQRILSGAGFTNVKFMDGSIVTWPYELVSGS
jgi:NADPH-dependent 2,4-dienoyl-CoA reductase/sulfur reductase-like enzyme/rhodanese-related sulfurtransferase